MSYPLKFIRVLINALRRSAYPLQAWNANFSGEWIRQKGELLALTAAPAIVFAPHQDDETLGCGGLLAQKQAIGAAVKVVFMTDGAFSPDVSLSPAIAAQRQQEAFNALMTLGIDRSQVTFLNYPDGDLNRLLVTQQSQILSQITELLAQTPVAEIFVPDRQDCHPDHEATCELVKQAMLQAKSQAQLWQYPIWRLWKKPFIQLLLSPSNAQSWQYLPISAAALPLKQQAIACHVSQMSALPPGFLKRFQQPYELFRKITL
jgi:N-acetylglucosamine malate deacetylase 1